MIVDFFMRNSSWINRCPSVVDEILLCRRQIPGHAVGYATVAIPAHAPAPDVTAGPGVPVRILDHLRDKTLVTTDAVLLDSRGRIIADPQVRTVRTKGHRLRVVEAVARLGSHLPGEVIVWKMAVDAGRLRSMRAVLPGRVVGTHGVAVDTDLRLTRQVGEHL